MFIHNKKKKFILSIVNFIIETICLPQKIFSKKNELNSIIPNKILLLRLDHIGDVVMTSPAFSLLREKFPNARIMLLTNPAGKQLFSNDHRIDEVLAFSWPWHHQKMREGFSWSKIKELIQLIRRLRKEKLDILIDFRGDLRFIALFGVLTGAKFRLSNSRSGESSLIHHISNYDIAKHEVERSLDVIECLVGSNGYIRPEIYLSDNEVPVVKALIEAETNAPFPEKFAILAPYSSREVKSWPHTHFREIIVHLLSQDFTVFVVGTREDRLNSEGLIGDFADNVFTLAGGTSIRELTTLISISSLVVGVDTGVLHLASCFDVPIVAIFGSTRSVEFRPYSPYAIVVESNTCVCNQFLHLKCDHAVNGYAKCLHELAPGPVIRAIEGVSKVRYLV